MAQMDIAQTLTSLADPDQAANLSRFFKTGPGQYGEGDRFLGIKMPVLRTVAKDYRELPFNDLSNLLQSAMHEHRMVALIILTLQYARGDEQKKKCVYEFYLSNRNGINNWDLVDVTTPRIVGDYLLQHPDERTVLYQYAREGTLWERRIAITATYSLLRAAQFDDTFAIADILLHDTHDLLHKAVGWMLREVGKRDQDAEEKFLRTRYQTMPRTMLRYAIERFEESKRQQYLKGLV